MLKAIAFGVAVGAAIQAWRNFPPDGPLSPDMVAVVACLAVLAAYLGGRWHGRHRGTSTAVAVASATAAAQATNQVVVNLHAGNGARSTGVVVPTEEASWMLDGPREVFELDQLDGLDVAELIEHHEHETGGAG